MPWIDLKCETKRYRQMKESGADRKEAGGGRGSGDGDGDELSHGERSEGLRF